MILTLERAADGRPKEWGATLRSLARLHPERRWAAIGRLPAAQRRLAETFLRHHAERRAGILLALGGGRTAGNRCQEGGP